MAAGLSPPFELPSRVMTFLICRAFLVRDLICGIQSNLELIMMPRVVVVLCVGLPNSIRLSLVGSHFSLSLVASSSSTVFTFPAILRCSWIDHLPVTISALISSA